MNSHINIFLSVHRNSGREFLLDYSFIWTFLMFELHSEMIKRVKNAFGSNRDIDSEELTGISNEIRHFSNGIHTQGGAKNITSHNYRHRKEKRKIENFLKKKSNSFFKNRHQWTIGTYVDPLLAFSKKCMPYFKILHFKNSFNKTFQLFHTSLYNEN